MDKGHFAYNYLKYSKLKVNEHGIHSPFVFALYNQVFKNLQLFYAYETLENIRLQLLQDKRKLNITDFGAGGAKSEKKIKTVQFLAKTAAKEKKYAQLLMRLVDHFQPSTILELGTNLGIGTMYLAIAQSNSTVFTLEGCPETQQIAIENFEKANLHNIKTILGNFDDTLPVLLKQLPSLDFVYFDGNHRKKPTLNYFEQCLQKAHEQSIFVVDDIYWSKEMTEAWEFIKNHPRVTVTLDLFQLGIVFFRKEQAKQHFVLKY